MLTIHLEELLKRNIRVILPGIGAFAIKKTASGQQITFNSILKFDDNVFVRFVSEQEKISIPAAAEKVRTYTEAILKAINDGNRYTLGLAGEIYRDANGKIQLLENKRQAVTLAAMDEPAPTPLEEKPSTGKDEPPASLQNEPLLIVESTPVAESIPTSAPYTETISTPAPAPTAPNIHSIKPPSDNIPVTEQQPTTTPTPEPEKITVESTQKMKKKRESSGWLWAIVIILLAGIIIVGYLLVSNPGEGYEPNKVLEFTQQQTVNRKPAVEKDEVLDIPDFSDEIITEQTDSINTAIGSTYTPNVEKNTAVELNSLPSGVYFLVAGCFKSKENAESYAKILVKQGYRARQFGVIRELFAVCYSEHPTRAEAEKEREKLIATGKSVWIYSNP